MPAADCFVSVIAPFRNDAGIVDSFVTEVMAVLKDSYENYELVLVDDGSVDDTAARVAGHLTKLDCIRLIRLSRTFGVEIAIAAGLDAVIGDLAVVMMPESDPPRLIPEMVRQARSGPGIVFGVREDRKSQPLLVRMASHVFYWYCQKWFKLDLPENSTYFRVLSRQVVNAVTRIKSKYPYLRLLGMYVGYGSQPFPYQPISRSGRSRRRRFLEAVSLANDIIVNNSAHPLRIVSWLGLLAGTLNVLYVGYVFLIYFLKAKVAEGWTTLSLQAAGMFFFLFLILTVLSEYVGRLSLTSRDQPLYYVLEEKTSAVLIADEQRRNVVERSVASDAWDAGHPV